ncbi:hypothetical protein F5B20DRAFT_226153 [Whalleya microplaca]|nr:hypothetical protein F5B20DRAFT_226153 [Whalleya microplaca]
MAEATDKITHKAPFDMLPDELVLIIIEFSISGASYTDPCGCPHSPHWTLCKALSLTCRRFNRLTTPLLYSSLYLAVPSKAATKPLYPVKRSLRQYCRKLTFDILNFSEQTEAHWQIAKDFAAGCTEVRCLSIRGGIDKHNVETWRFVDSMLAHMHTIEHLSLSAGTWGLWLPQVLEHIDIPTLRCLYLNNIGKVQTTKNVIRSGKNRTASFTTLHVSEYEDSVAAMDHFIRWPRQLRHFHFGARNLPDYLDLSTFAPWLSVHKDTLETIDLDFLPSTDERKLIDVSDFPQLKSLKLPILSFRPTLEFSLAQVDCLFSPRLEVVTWSFDYYDEHSDGQIAFGDKEEQWLRQFAKVAASKPSPFKKIVVMFKTMVEDIRIGRGTVSRWDYLDRVKEYSRQLNIELEYYPPRGAVEHLHGDWCPCLRCRMLSEGGYANDEQ